MQKIKLIALVSLFISTADFTHTFAQRNNREESRDRQQPAQTNRNGSKNNQKPKWGATVQSAPRRTTVLKSPQSNYHYRDGVYYRPDNGGYRVGPAPVGVRIRTLPTGFTRILLGGIPYFYYYGTFYRNVDQSNYEVVVPPVGAIVYNLPDGYEKVIIDGISYYSFDGVYYKAFVDDRGEVAYEVVGDIRR